MKQIDGLKVAAVLLLWLSCSLNNPFLENSNQGSDRSDYLSPKIGRLIYVPEGKFRRHNWSSGVTAISRGYRMSQYEITREQFSAVMGADPSDPSKSSGPNDPVQNVSWYQAIAFCNQLSFAEGLTPVYEVPGVNFATLPYADIPTENSASWNSAVVTAGSNGYRLPTEMEWQWAAMGADQDSTGVFDDGVNMTGLQKKFAGDDGSALLGDYTVFGYPASPKFLGETNTERTNQVGSRLPNELGFF
jgi:sulfatase modifying factor 1